jgi:tyrosyl-tRNA synthetase
MTPEEKYERITRNLQEVVGEDSIREILKERDLKIYWGTAPTGKPHIGYFVPMFKIRDLLNAGCDVTILLADIHAFLDSIGATWEQVNYRTQYYQFIITEMLKSVGADIFKLKFVTGKDFQTKEEYTLDVYRISAISSSRDTQRAGAEVVKQADNPRMSGLIYPILQALDEEYLGVDVQFGGVDQRKIFMFAREFLPKIGYKKRCHLMNPMVGGLNPGGKMSASDPNSKIDILDTPKQVAKKLNKGFCEEGNVEENWFLDFSKLVMFPHLKDEGKDFVINRDEKFGGPITYTNFDEMKIAFANKGLHPADLKLGVIDYVNGLLDPIRVFAEEQKIAELAEKAYGN